MNRQNLRTAVRGAYDLQKLRIQMGNRIVGNFKAKLGQAPGEKEDHMDAEGQAILNDLRRHYKKITDGVKTFPRQATFKGDEVISNFTELCLISQYLDLENNETTHFLRLKQILREFPIYVEFLEGIYGVGPAMAGVIISEIDITRAEYPSSLWKYAGLDVAPNGAGRSRKKEHLIEIEYTDKDGKPARRAGITFNPWLKTKLVGVLASSFLKQDPEKCPYRNIYDDYKRRLEHSPQHCDLLRIEGDLSEILAIEKVRDSKEKAYKDGYRYIAANYQMARTEDADIFTAHSALRGQEIGKYRRIKTKGHRHNMAMRYMIKRFLVDLYNVWRPLEGLSVAPEYSEAKLGKTHKMAA